MIMFFLCLIGFMICVVSGSWGVTAVVVVVLGFLMLCASEERKTGRAWQNRRDYWAEVEEK